MRVLLFLLLILLVLGVARSRPLRPRASHRPPPPGPPQDMVPCAHCGVHVPRQDAIAAGPVFYCSDDHRRQGGA